MAGRRRPGLFSLLLTLLGLVAGCRTVPAPDPTVIARLEAELGQLLLVGFTGTDAPGNADVERLLCETRVGGIVLFGRNVVSAEQVGRLTRALAERSAACAGRPLLIAMDAEGGRVMRLSPSAGFSPTLSHQQLGDDNDFTETELEARRIGYMLRDAGVNWNLAPVVDVGYNPANPVIVGLARSFGANPGLVTAQARAYVRGMRQAGVLTALKHFPGHGSSFADSHLGFVDVTKTGNPDVELAPYRALIAEQLADSIMTAHVFNEHLDRHWPATLSRGIVTGLLRRDLGFDGVVVSDDLRMGAIEQHYGIAEAAVRAISAGVDVLVIAQDRLPDGSSAARAALAALRAAIERGRLRAGRVDDALRHVAALKSKLRH